MSWRDGTSFAVKRNAILVIWMEPKAVLERSGHEMLEARRRCLPTLPHPISASPETGVFRTSVKAIATNTDTRRILLAQRLWTKESATFSGISHSTPTRIGRGSRLDSRANSRYLLCGTSTDGRAP